MIVGGDAERICIALVGPSGLPRCKLAQAVVREDGFKGLRSQPAFEDGEAQRDGGASPRHSGGGRRDCPFPACVS